MNPFLFMRLDGYLLREVFRPFAATCSLFILLFAGYSSAQMLADAVAGLLPMEIVWQLVGLRIMIALEVLLPIALYLSVVMGLGRLHTDSEMTAMAACGYGEGRVVWTIFRMALLVSIIVACFAMMIRPWAYKQSYVLQNRAETQFDIRKLEAGRFHASEKAEYVIFAEGVDSKDAHLNQVFFSRPQSDRKIQAVYARTLSQSEGEEGRSALVFENGYVYELDASGGNDLVVHFQTLTLILAGTPQPLGYRSKAAKMAELWGADNSKDIAELQWRLLRPVSAILLALVAVPMSRTAPRQGRYARTVMAIIVFAVYYNLSGMAKTWVKEGVVGAIPGAWWPDVLLLLIICAWYGPNWLNWWRAQRLQLIWGRR